MHYWAEIELLRLIACMRLACSRHGFPLIGVWRDSSAGHLRPLILTSILNGNPFIDILRLVLTLHKVTLVNKDNAPLKEIF